MKKAKKVLSFLTTAMMLGSIAMPAEPVMQLGAVLTVRAEERSDPTSGTCGENVTWKYDTATKTLTISGTGEMDGMGYGRMPWDGLEITSAVFEDGVTNIGDGALLEQASLTSVSIPNSVTSIGTNAFAFCRSLTSVTIPDSVTYFGGYAFDGTPWLEEQLALSPYVVVNHVVIDADPETCTADLVLPENVMSIGDGAFSGCSSLTSVTIRETVTSIGQWAFADCSSLTSVTIPESMTSIGGSAFDGTAWLEKQFALSPFAIVNHIIIDADPEACCGDQTIPDGVARIGDGAFCDCRSLTSVTISDSVTSIGKWAFQNCFLLTSVMIPDSVTNIENGAFNECVSLASVTIPDGVTSIADSTFFYCISLTSVKIPSSVTRIGNSAFGVCTSLTSVMIPKGVTSISYCAFADCSSLTSVTIPDSVTSVGKYAFAGCSDLTSITIKNPDCKIYNNASTIFNMEEIENWNTIYTFTGTIYGYDDSTAQAYAEKYGRTFKSLGPAPAHPADTLGDVSGDNVINAGDAAITLSAAAAYGVTGSYGNMTDAQIAAADIDDSGNVNASDAAYILQYAAMRGANGKDFDIRELVK